MTPTTTPAGIPTVMLNIYTPKRVRVWIMAWPADGFDECEVDCGRSAKTTTRPHDAAQETSMKTKLDSLNIDIQAIAPAQVARAYSGRIGCACGCRGKYFDAGTREATKVLRQLQALDAVESFSGLYGESVITAEVKGRALTVYLKKG